jgi:hypothetical protein
VRKLREEKELLQRNYLREVEFYLRERVKDLLTIHKLLLANQIERAQYYIESELNQLLKTVDGQEGL